jgi:hypothetical protein
MDATVADNLAAKFEVVAELVESAVRDNCSGVLSGGLAMCERCFSPSFNEDFSKEPIARLCDPWISGTPPVLLLPSSRGACESP